MLRRVLKALRVGSLLAGVVILLWLPLSFFYGMSLILPWPGAYSSTLVLDGHVSIASREDNPFISFDTAHANIYKLPQHQQTIKRALWPRVSRSLLPAGNTVVTQTDIGTPLWLIAACLLAWPVTSIIRARRRLRVRGFEVTGEPQWGPGAEPRAGLPIVRRMVPALSCALTLGLWFEPQETGCASSSRCSGRRR